jgi:acetyl/propionyl-CoA carboxylase alpha subunit
MIAKLISYGKDREEAIERMLRAIEEYEITGIETTLGFGKFVMQHEAFKTGNFDTHFVGKYFTPESLKAEDETEALIAAVIAARLFQKEKPVVGVGQAASSSSNWKKNRQKY